MLYRGTAPSCLIWRGFVVYSCIAVWLPDSKRKHYLSIELFTLKEIPGVSTWLLSDLKRICWVFMHGCLTPWLKEEALPVYWAVHTEGDPWREYLIVVWLEEDLLHTHALLSGKILIWQDLLPGYWAAPWSASGCPKRNRCENLFPVFAPLLASGCPKRNRCANSLLVSAPLLASGCLKRNRCANPLPVSAPLLTSGCPKRNRCANPLPVSAPLLTSGCPKRNRCANPLPVSAPLLTSGCLKRNRCENPFPVSAPLLASGCPKRNRCANPLPASAPLLTSGCPKRNRCANPLPVSASLLTSVCRRGTAVWTSYAAWRRRESDQPVLFSLGFSLF